jgi:protein-S-isoprenylcysteine O-methyltransferase Ste14
MTAEAAPAPSRLSLLLLDGFERVWISALFALLAWRLLGAEGSAYHLVLLLSEGAAVFFILTRRSAGSISPRPLDWALAFAAASGPMLVTGGGEALAPGQVCMTLMLAGALFQLWAKLTLRRSFGVAPANRGVKADGPYRIVRHPMYAGYLVTHLGFWLLHPTAWNAAIYLGSFGLQVARLMAEERVLNEDPAYQALRRRVRFRLVPGVF